jgi:KDO2-lipid IV(A) lauroyltransferase
VKQAPVRHRLEQAAAAPLLALLRGLPHGAARRLGGALGALAWAADGRRRATARENLAAALPELDAAARARAVRACFRHFGAVFADAISAARFDRVELCGRVEAAGVDHLLAADRRGRGTIVLSAHFGNWEIVPPYIAHAAGPMAVVGRPLDNPHLDLSLRALRTRFGNRMLPKRGAVREMFRVLREGGRLGLLLDQRVRPEEAIEVDFFGRPAWTSPIVARLAAKTGAAILPAFGDHAPGGRYRVEFLAPIEAGPADDEASVRELTRRCVALYETVIRRAPERWLWMHRRWKR